MKKLITFISATALLSSYFVVAPVTFADSDDSQVKNEIRQEEKLKIRNDRMEIKAEQKNQIEIQRARQGQGDDDSDEDGREKIRNDEERRSRMEDHREERIILKSDRIETFVDLMIRRFNAMVDRLDTLADRIESRIDKLKEEGVDTASSEAKLLEARVKIAEAESLIVILPLHISVEVTDIDGLHRFIKEYRERIKDVKEALKDAHRALVDSIKEIKKGQNKNSSSDDSPDDDSDSSSDDS